MYKEQIITEIKFKALNFSVDEIQLTDAEVPIFASAMKDFKEIDPYYKWVCVMSGSDEPGCVDMLYQPHTESETPEIIERFYQRQEAFFDDLEKVQSP